MDQTSPPVLSAATTRMRVAAFGVHLFTALGAGIALIAMLEAVREHWASMFGWLGVALIIDAIDGPLARKFDVVRRVAEHFQKLYEVIAVDGARINFAEGWGLVRASNTQPVLVLRFEATTPALLKKYRDEVEQAVENARA